MKEAMRVLVTAVGGDLGQGIVKALRLGRRAAVCYGCDMAADGIGPAFVEGFESVPAADEKDYLKALAAVARAFDVDAVIPASEPEIRRLAAAEQGTRLGGVPVLVQSPGWLATFGDKLKAMRALEGRLPLVPYADGSDHTAVQKLVEDSGFPIVVKPRLSSGSRHLHVARDMDRLNRALEAVPAPVAQAFIDDRLGEYSVGLFRCEGAFAAIAFRRELGPVGNSWFAEYVEDQGVLAYARTFAEAADLEGVANIQLRASAEGVRLLEVNPRFSSLVAARAACGFHDVEWEMDRRLGGKPELPSSYRPLRFHRYFHELVDFGDGFGVLEAWTPRATR